MTPERLAVFRKSFGPMMTTEEIRAIVEGRKPHKLGQETLEALRLMLAERKGGGPPAIAFVKPIAKATPFPLPSAPATGSCNGLHRESKFFEAALNPKRYIDARY